MAQYTKTTTYQNLLSLQADKAAWREIAVRYFTDADFRQKLEDYSFERTYKPEGGDLG